MLKIFRKVDVKKPAGATPHGRVAFVRFGAESCARRARKKMRSWAVNKGKHFCSKRNENDIKKLEKSLLYHLPGPRLTDTLRLSGSELKCRQKTAGDFATSASAFSSLSRVGPQRKEEKRRQEERRRKKSNKKARRASSILIPPNSRSPAPGGKILQLIQLMMMTIYYH